MNQLKKRIKFCIICRVRIYEARMYCGEDCRDELRTRAKEMGLSLDDYRVYMSDDRDGSKYVEQLEKNMIGIERGGYTGESSFSGAHRIITRGG